MEEKGVAGYHMLMHFQFDLCQYMNIKGRNMDSQRLQYEIMMVIIRCSSLETLWSQWPITVRINITMLRNMVVTGK